MNAHLPVQGSQVNHLAVGLQQRGEGGAKGAETACAARVQRDIRITAGGKGTRGKFQEDHHEAQLCQERGLGASCGQPGAGTSLQGWRVRRRLRHPAALNPPGLLERAPVDLLHLGRSDQAFAVGVVARGLWGGGLHAGSTPGLLCSSSDKVVGSATPRPYNLLTWALLKPRRHSRARAANVRACCMAGGCRAEAGRRQAEVAAGGAAPWERLGEQQNKAMAGTTAFYSAPAGQPRLLWARPCGRLIAAIG